MNLTDYVRQVSQDDFGKEFRHQAVWNRRLKTTGGRFFPKDGHLDFNPLFYEQLDLSVFRQIVRHELCHYHLYFEKKGYKHTDADFKRLLKEVDGLRYAPRLPQKGHTLLYRCQFCGKTYPRQRRLDTKKYRCSACYGLLALEE